MKTGSSDSHLERFDVSKATVASEIRDGFFRPDGSLRMTEREILAWVSDRAIDEYKVASQLAYVLHSDGHRMPIKFTQKLAEQIADELRHLQILRGVLPEDLQASVDRRILEFPDLLSKDEHWQQMRDLLDRGDFHLVLLEINIVHEGYSAAAIDVLRTLPIPSIANAYDEIGRDEAKHHRDGREFLEWLLEQGGKVGTITERVSSDGGGSMAWSWPVNPETEESVTAARGSMAWSWPVNPETEESVTAARGSMAWSWPVNPGTEESVAAARGSMAWSWPVNPGTEEPAMTA